ncbi:TerC family protein [Paenibacillus sp. FA6]|uniref:TerC family protein n=1 Tax=Paenibacillus sp. FA6 TaxID=3413029 RepID=UPI003F655797
MEQMWLLLEILVINLVLSGDNAVVIALASKDLPPAQRKKTVWWGAMGAIVLRCLLTLVAVLMLKIPYLQAFGGIMLLWIAFQLLSDEKKELRVGETPTISKAIRTIIAADFIMSLDNVLAIAGLAKGDISLIVIGIALSIPIVIYGSTIIIHWLHRFPILVYFGAGILGYTAGEMILQDSSFGGYLSALWPDGHSVLPMALAIIVVLSGGLRKMASHRV